MRTDGARATATSTSSTASKRFITNAGVAQPLHRLREDRPRRRATAGISAFVVEADTPGLRGRRGSSRRWGSRARRPASSSSTDCRVPAANRLGEEGEGFRIAMRILDRSRPGIAAQALGIAQGATDYALEYAKTRETMGKPIAQHQLIAGEARRHGDRVRGGARAALPLRRRWSTRASTAPS